MGRSIGTVVQVQGGVVDCEFPPNELPEMFEAVEVERPDAEPLVLDNLVDTISPASRRTDLLPVFSFNGSGLWTAKQRGKGIFAGGSDRLKAWKDLRQKMTENKL